MTASLPSYSALAGNSTTKSVFQQSIGAVHNYLTEHLGSSGELLAVKIDEGVNNSISALSTAQVESIVSEGLGVLTTSEILSLLPSDLSRLSAVETITANKTFTGKALFNGKIGQASHAITSTPYTATFNYPVYTVDLGSTSWAITLSPTAGSASECTVIVYKAVTDTGTIAWDMGSITYKWTGDAAPTALSDGLNVFGFYYSGSILYCMYGGVVSSGGGGGGLTTAQVASICTSEISALSTSLAQSVTSKGINALSTAQWDVVPNVSVQNRSETLGGRKTFNNGLTLQDGYVAAKPHQIVLSTGSQSSTFDISTYSAFRVKCTDSSLTYTINATAGSVTLPPGTQFTVTVHNASAGDITLSQGSFFTAVKWDKLFPTTLATAKRILFTCMYDADDNGSYAAWLGFVSPAL